MNNVKPIVAHISHIFFAKPETFIYHSISNLKQFHPICLCWKIDNLELFPFPERDLHKISLKYNPFEFYRDLVIKRWNDPQAKKRAERIIKEKDVRFIHAHYGYNGYFALNTKKKLNIPLITTFYGIDISCFPRAKKWKSRFKILFQEGDLFLVEGEYMKLLLKDLGCPDEKIHIQRIGIPLHKIKYRPRRPKKNNDKVVFIFGGRFEEKKGLIYALKAVYEVRSKYQNFEFRIIGDGTLRPQIEKFIENHDMKNYVQMLGFLNYEDYLKEMNNADIFVHPSVKATNGDMEGGAPTTILEAQAMGMPVISTYHADIPNIVVEGKSALLSKEKDYKAIACSMEYLLETQEAWEQMGSIGREFVETYHNIYNEVDRLEEIYSQLL